MPFNFQTTQEFKIDKHIKNLSKTNIYKHMLLQKKLTKSLFYNFFIMIYFMYFRISLAFGTAMLTNLEALVMNSILLLMFLAAIDQMSRLLFFILLKVIKVVKALLWIYQNIHIIKDN